MTAKQGKSGVIDVKALLEGETDYLRAMVRAVTSFVWSCWRYD